MATISEYGGERLLYVEEEATDPTDGQANTAQREALVARLTAVLKARGIEPEPWNFRKSYYKHGGVLHLTVSYVLQHHTRTHVAE